jgi:hypothetical protein
VEGAWLTVIIVPCTIGLLGAVRRYYDEFDRQLLRGSHRCIDLQQPAPPVVLVPIKRWDRLARKAVEYALRLSPNVTACTSRGRMRRTTRGDCGGNGTISSSSPRFRRADAAAAS